MVEIGIAIAAATKAVGTLKQGLALGNDLVSLKADFNKVFDAKNAVERAKAKQANRPLAKKLMDNQSVEGHALDFALETMQIKQLEKDLKDAFIYSGRGDEYKLMMRERRRETQRREVMSAQMIREAEEKKKLIADIALISAIIVSGTGLTFLIMWMVLS